MCHAGQPTWTLLLAAVAAAAAGCAGGPPSGPLPMEPWSHPLPYSICVLPPQSPALPLPVPNESGATDSEAADDESTPAGFLRVDAARIERQLADAFTKSRVCSVVEVLDSESYTLATARLEAKRRGCDLLVHFKSLDAPTYRFSHRTGWAIPNTVLWFFLGFPSFWVRDRVYTTDWRLVAHAESLTAGTPLTGRGIVLAVENEYALNVSERGWTFSALYTPPGYYEGPLAGPTLASCVERAVVREVLAWWKRYRESLEQSFDVEIEIHAPENFSRQPSKRVRLDIEIASPSPLTRLRLEVDGRRVYERDALTMLRPREELPGGGRRYRLPKLTLRAGEGEHRLRVLAQRVGAEKNWWSAAKTVRFWVEPAGLP